MATVTIYASSVSGTGWTNPSNASGASDSSYATVTLARNTTRTLTASFTNSLPDGAIINSITVYCRLYRSNTTTLNTSTFYGTTVTIPTSIGNISHSVGTSFPSSVALSIRTNQRNNLPTIYVDSFWLEVDYTEPVQERLFPYEIDSISASEMIETSTTETSATIVTTNEGTLGTDGARIDYRIPLASGKTATLEFDYTTDITSIYFYFRDSRANSIVDFINERDTTNGHISVKLSNPSPTSDYIILRYKTYREGTTTLSNLTITEVARLFPYEYVPFSGSMSEIETTATSTTLKTPLEEQSISYYKIPCPYGQSGTIDFDYTSDVGSFYLKVSDYVNDSYVPITDDTNPTDTSGHVTIEFTNNGEGNLNYVFFHYETFHVGTTTLSNFTVTIESESINNFRLGDITPTAFYLGDTPVKKIYLGETLVYRLV